MGYGLGRINHGADGAMPQDPAPQGAPRLWGERGKKKREENEKKVKERKKKKKKEKIHNKAGYTAISCGRVGRGGSATVRN